MIEQLFIRIVNMSLTGSAVILAVILLRFLLKKAPKIFSYCLWAAVLFRLLCPVSFTAAFSLFSMLQIPSAASGKMEYIPEDLITYPQADAPLFPANDPADSDHIQLKATDPNTAKPSRTELLTKTASRIWLLGIAVLLFLNMINLIKLQRKLKTASLEKDNIFLTGETLTPFVIGIFRPRIYLPYHLDAEEKEYVLLHEQIHLQRKDHIIKLISYLALCLHWFNPLVWAAFFLSEKDMEMSCDEAVIRKIGSSVKGKYSTSLLSMAAGTSVISSSPLAFGERDTGSRIKNILHYKKPAAIVVRSAALLCAIAAAILLANPDIRTEAENISANAKSQDNTKKQTAAKGQSSTKKRSADKKQSGSENLAATGNQNSSNKQADAESGRATAAARTRLPDGAVKPGQSVYEVNVRSIARSARVIDVYNIDPVVEFPFQDGESLAFADDCQFSVNYSMYRPDYQAITFDQFASLVDRSGNHLNRPCLLVFENGLIVYAALDSAWDHYGISPLWYVPYNNLYGHITGTEGDDEFYQNFKLVSSESLDIADSKGTETIEVYKNKGKNPDTSIVQFKNANGKLLYMQDASISRAGWNNIYLGSTGESSFILNLQIEDRFNTCQISYQSYRLDKNGSPLLAAASSFLFDLTGGSEVIYDDAVFQKWIAPLEYYLENSHLIVSSQNGKIRTAKISEANKYNYDTLSFKDRIVEIIDVDHTFRDRWICYHGCWYRKDRLEQETADWLLWYNSLTETEQLKISYVPFELNEKSVFESATQNAATKDE